MSDLLSCNIIEKDCNGDVIWAWTYPKTTEKEKKVILRKCQFDSPNKFHFGRVFLKWFYMLSLDVADDNPNLPDVKEFICVLWAKDFSPDKYEKLCQIMCKTYQDSGNAVSLLQLYLSVITKGVCTTKDNGVFTVKEFNSNSYQKKTMIKDLVKLFGLEIILIYTVLLLKKKLLVYHHNLATLLQWMPSFPAIMTHRKATEELFPWLDPTPDDLEQLKMSTGYVAGFYDNSILTRSDLFDVLVNIPAREITISPQAKENLAMTKIHKDIALFLVQLLENGKEEIEILKAIDEKTQDLLSQLRSYGTTGDNGEFLLTVENLKDKNLSPAAENFFFQLALAENMLLM